jgi:hypothetical protein
VVSKIFSSCRNIKYFQFLYPKWVERYFLAKGRQLCASSAREVHRTEKKEANLYSPRWPAVDDFYPNSVRMVAMGKPGGALRCTVTPLNPQRGEE